MWAFVVLGSPWFVVAAAISFVALSPVSGGFILRLWLFAGYAGGGTNRGASFRGKAMGWGPPFSDFWGEKVWGWWPR